MSIQIIFLAHQNKRVKKPSKYKENVYLFSLIILEFLLLSLPFLFIHYDNIMVRQSLLIPSLTKPFFFSSVVFLFYLILLFVIQKRIDTHVLLSIIRREYGMKENQKEMKKKKTEKKTRTCESFCFPIPRNHV